MVGLSALCLILLTLTNYSLGKSLVYPPVIYCSAWAAGLVCLLVSGDMFYPILPESLMIFLAGALAFSFGSGTANLFPLRFKPSKIPRDPEKIVNWCIALLILAFPFYVLWLMNLVSAHPGDFFK